MACRKSIWTISKPLETIIFLALTIICTASTRILTEEETPVPAKINEEPDAAATPVSSVPPVVPAAPAAATSAVVSNADTHHPLSFFMHDVLGGSNPSARAVTGIVTNPAINAQVAFAKPNGANLPINSGIPQNNNNNGIINNNNIPFLTGLGGNTANVIQNNGNNLNNGGIGFPVATGGQLPAGVPLQNLMFGTLTVIDDELTEGHELGSGLLGKAQGFYIASSVDGSSQTMAFTAMFQKSGYADSLSFFGVHRTAVSESHLAVMGGTGKYVNAQGYVIVKTYPASSLQQHNTDGVETVLQFTVYLTYKYVLF
ncbi:Dirigent protein [Quillaja saponaria]|uniref:Dirigent protein n=1 Tax=Quillaja saponaria TaxID=32244 RepID=A0AAD7QG84_QUISA|nr:Dirigent protein [Quillaja saponaria]